ncbi:MAG TPA: DUF2505 family protein [Iamia sp.]
MRFDLTQTIAAPVDEVARAYASAELYEHLGGTDKLGPPDVLDRSETGDTVTLRIRYRFVADLSPAVTAVVDPKKLTWVEQSIHDLAARTVAVTLHPDHYADRLRCTGRYGYRSNGEATTIRQIDGELKVKALLVGGQVEKAIVSGLKEHLEAEAPQVEAYLLA